MKEILAERSFLYNKIREFFTEKNFLEVETPLLLPGLIPESAIDTFKTAGHSPLGVVSEFFLPPSPEISMKILLARGAGDIFQICKAFRNCEEETPHHSREFSMLEWYKLNIKAKDNIEITEELLKTVLPEKYTFPFPVIELDQLFKEKVGFSFVEYNSRTKLGQKASEIGIPVTQDDTCESLFNKIFLTYIEPDLKEYPGVFISGYPAFIPTLAKKRGDNPLLSERWELYLDGIEIANCYTEETEAEAVDSYIKEEITNGAIVPVPPQFSKIFKKGTFPRCSGVALGLDRLLLIIVKKHSLEEIIPRLSSYNNKGD